MFVVGGTIGYVLGARAGRARYEKIKAKAQSFWQSPTVQQKAVQAQEFAKERAPEVQQKLAEATSRVTSAVADKVGGDDAPTAAGAHHRASSAPGAVHD
jgi:hypothetical protein